DQRIDTLKQARSDIERISKEVQAADPYPGSGRWLPRLQQAARAVERGVASRGNAFPWLDAAVKRFEEADQKTPLAILGDLDKRLALLQESYEAPNDAGSSLTPEQIKALVPRDRPTDDRKKTPEKAVRKDDERERVRRDDEFAQGPYRQRGDGGLVG